MTCSCCCSNFKMNSGAQDAQTGTLLFESFGGFGKGKGVGEYSLEGGERAAEQADAGPVKNNARPAPRRGDVDHQELARAAEAAYLSRSSHGHRYPTRPKDIHLENLENTAVAEASYSSNWWE